MYSTNLPIGAAYKVLRMLPDSLPSDSLALSALSARFNLRRKGPISAALTLGLKNLLAALMQLLKFLKLLLHVFIQYCGCITLSVMIKPYKFCIYVCRIIRQSVIFREDVTQTTVVKSALHYRFVKKVHTILLVTNVAI